MHPIRSKLEGERGVLVDALKSESEYNLKELAGAEGRNLD